MKRARERREREEQSVLVILVSNKEPGMSKTI